MKIFGQLAVRIVVLAAVLGAAGRALAERPADRLVATSPGPLYGTPDGGEGELLAFDARVAPALASLAAGERIAVDGWPVAPGVARTMVLTRTEVYAPDARIVAITPGGTSATAPTMVSPRHNSTVTQGNITLGWSPVPGATLYQYYVASGVSTVTGVTPGLFVQVPLTGTGGGTLYNGIVRACPAGATCVAGSETGWAPWSNAPGGPGVTNFTVTP